MFSKIARIPSIVKWFYPSWYIWDKKTGKKIIYLTFDDGPVPEVTDFVLDTLSRKRKKPIPATFFCIGDNVRKNPTIFKRILKEGHSIGNHTFNHLKGTKTPLDIYIKNVQLANLEMAKHLDTTPKELSTTLFRPPYGMFKKKQGKALKDLGYKIIMYRVVGYDWHVNVSAEDCYQNIIKNTKDGDIIVLHDSLKAAKNMEYALPKALRYFEKNGFVFEKL
ncbi:peptidoglycan/xylan/chitin deacetylase (PgdA/CDA1 family) [Dokdonia sp. Hel_I_53]|nr:peptidoglycan/xylan/chitin deacetylase (PgdA/CDA1 family) [Dokdonia sp. Hel_I_53]